MRSYILLLICPKRFALILKGSNIISPGKLAGIK